MIHNVLGKADSSFKKKWPRPVSGISVRIVWYCSNCGYYHCMATLVIMVITIITFVIVVKVVSFFMFFGIAYYRQAQTFKHPNIQTFKHLGVLGQT
jgi:hypothetical protein